MINDEHSGDYDETDNVPDERKVYSELIEKEFFEKVKRGESLYVYLYLPLYLVTPKMADHLDKYLIENAYDNMFGASGVGMMDVVYSDKFLTLTVENPTVKLSILKKMLDWFTEIQEFEKCAVVLKELKRTESLS